MVAGTAKSKYEALALAIALRAGATRLFIEAPDPAKMCEEIMAAFDRDLAALLSKNEKRKTLLLELRAIAEAHLRGALARVLSDQAKAGSSQ